MKKKEETNRMMLENAKWESAIKSTLQRSFKLISVDRIDVSKSADFACDVDPKRFEQNLMDNGVLTPLSVVGPYPGEMYVPIDGVRRYEALKSHVNGKKIPCYIVSGPVDSKELRKLAVAANALNRGSDAAIIMEYEELFWHEEAATECSVARQIAACTGKTERQAQKYNKVYLDGSPKVKKMVANGKAPVDVANEIINACDNDLVMQDELLDIYNSAEHGEKGIIRDDIKKNKGKLIHKNPTKTVAKARLKKEIDDVESALSIIIRKKDRLSKTEAKKIIRLCEQTIEILS